MPERHVRISCHVDSERMGSVVNIEQQTETSARAPGETELRVYGDVVTLIRTGRRTSRSVAASATSTGGILRVRLLTASRGSRSGGRGSRCSFGLILRSALRIA